MSPFDKQLCEEASKLFPKVREELLDLPLRPAPAKVLNGPEIPPTKEEKESPSPKVAHRKRSRKDSSPDEFNK